MNLRDFWYIVCESKELRPGKILARKVLGEWIAVFRGTEGAAAAVLDRCMHRSARLSTGSIVSVENQSCIRCPYHGWTYDAQGQVRQVPSEGPQCSSVSGRKIPSFQVRESQGYVYVCLNAETDFEPFTIPHVGEKGWKTIRLLNKFQNSVINCAENFIDIPHTVFVHPGIFRTTRSQKFGARVTRKDGSVIVDYQNETKNLGFFSWFLNPSGGEIKHIDRFYMPNVTNVEYQMGTHRHFFITSQSVPVTERETWVYTDLTYDYGVWNTIAAPLVRFQAQVIIDQDIEILANQGETIERYGSVFAHSQADVIHVMVESIQREIEQGRDPRLLPEKTSQIEFWV